MGLKAQSADFSTYLMGKGNGAAGCVILAWSESIALNTVARRVKIFRHQVEWYLRNW